MKTIQVLSLLCLCVLFAAVEGKRLRWTEGDAALEGYLREAIENFRIQMPNGIKEINMPVLDPLKLNDMDFQVNENIATLNLKLQQMTIRGLSDFSVDYIKANLEELFIHINLSIPAVVADGQYRLHGRLFKIFPLDGNGAMNINVTDIEVSGTGQLILTNETMQMNTLKLDLYWEKMFINLENFMGGGSFSEVLQRLIPGVGRDVFLNYKRRILSPLENALKCKVNQMLNKQIVKDILKEILPTI